MMASVAGAGDLLQWQNNSLSYLYGDNFELDPETQHTMTFEHVSGWAMGDLFVFVDTIYFDGARDINDNQLSYYGEISPRLSASKMSGQDLSFLFVQDVLLSGCFEFGEAAEETPLVGVAVDLAIPGFDFFQLNAYRRFNDGSADPESYQLTPVWKMTFPIGEATSLVFDGFIDWVIAEGTDNLHICPQFKLDVGALMGMDAGALYAGVEYDYWKNKYGVKDGDFGLDSDQSCVSALVKYHF
jgi:nucleoside-specific outer membrane channel protein Tsx